MGRAQGFPARVAARTLEAMSSTRLPVAYVPHGGGPWPFVDIGMDPREKAAWDEHLMSEDPVPLSVLGERFGVTKQRMGQIVMALRKRLKDHLVRELGPDVQLDYSVDVD